MRPFSMELARTELTPQKEPMVIGKASYRADIEDGHNWVVEYGPDGDKKYPIEHVMGGKNVFYFLTSLDRGRLQVLPVAYDVRRQAWLDTTGSAVRHFGDLRDVPLDWRERQLTFNTSCYGCHVSQLSTNYELKTDTYHTTWSEPGINCETCHGPAGEHVRVFREALPEQKIDDIRIISTKNMSVDQLNSLCAPCHAKMAVVTTGFKPGDRYFDHFDLLTLEDADFYPDGRDLGENYTYTSWMMSPCAKSGQLSCMHCHTSSGRYRFFGDEANNACLPCHQERVEQAVAHTRHPAGSEGNKCVACHMPTTEFARMRRSDHSMRPPAPAATIAFKSPNACNLCHADKEAAWADKYVREWRSRDYQAPILKQARLIEAARNEDWSRLPEMLAYLSTTDRDEVFANSLVRLLGSCGDERKWPVLINTLQDRSPLIRSSAAEALSGYLAPASFGALLGAVRDEYRLVRLRAAASLAGVPERLLSEADRAALAAATAEFEQVMTARPDDHSTHYNLGNFYMSRGQFDRALESFTVSSTLQPDSIPPLVNASLAYNATGRNDFAEQSLRRALKLDPTNGPANLNMGLLLAELGRPAEAESALQAAFKADPRSAVAAYNLGVLLADDRPAESLDWCRKAAALRPQDPKYAHTYAFFLQRNGQPEPAVETLSALLDRHPTHLDSYALLGEIYEQTGRRREARSVYERALSVDRIPDASRMHFEAKVRELASH